MFTFFNTVEVLPIFCVDRIYHFLRDSGLAVPVVLKAKSGMPGFVALLAWIPLSEPVCRLLPTELVVAENRATELRHLLNRFVREVQEVVKIAEREVHNRQDVTGDLESVGAMERLLPATPPAPRLPGCTGAIAQGAPA